MVLRNPNKFRSLSGLLIESTTAAAETQSGTIVDVEIRLPRASLREPDNPLLFWLCWVGALCAVPASANRLMLLHAEMTEEVGGTVGIQGL
jgi:hypothetical protein